MAETYVKFQNPAGEEIKTINFSNKKRARQWCRGQNLTVKDAAATEDGYIFTMDGDEIVVPDTPQNRRNIAMQDRPKPVPKPKPMGLQLARGEITVEELIALGWKKLEIPAAEMQQNDVILFSFPRQGESDHKWFTINQFHQVISNSDNCMKIYVKETPLTFVPRVDDVCLFLRPPAN